MSQLVDNLKQMGVLRSKKVEEAFRKVDRKNFLPEEIAGQAYIDDALPLGYGQTISQPFVVAFMLEQLDLKNGDVVVDMGYGSGWQSALISSIVGENGKVYAYEIVSELCNFGKENIKKYPELFKRITFFCKSGKHLKKDLGKLKVDKIISAARINKLPLGWREALRVGGILIYPKYNSLFKEVKLSRTNWQITEYPGFVFVPFVE